MEVMEVQVRVQRGAQILVAVVEVLFKTLVHLVVLVVELEVAHQVEQELQVRVMQEETLFLVVVAGVNLTALSTR